MAKSKKITVEPVVKTEAPVKKTKRTLAKKNTEFIIQWDEISQPNHLHLALCKYANDGINPKDAANWNRNKFLAAFRNQSVTSEQAISNSFEYLFD
jgi:hypothetical protein